MRQRLIVLLLAMAVMLLGPATAAQADTATQLPFTNKSTWIAVDPVAHHVFVSGGAGSSSIVVLDYDGNIVMTISGEGGASQMALDTATNTLYVALHDAGAISAIDTQTLTETKRFSTSPYANPSSLVIANGKLWFSCTDNGSQCVVSANLDGTGMAAESLLGIGTEQEAGTALAAGGAGDKLLAVSQLNSEPTAAAVYDVSQDPPALVSSSDNTGCENGQDSTMDPAGANLFLACGIPYALLDLSTSDLSSATEYTTGNWPEAVATSADGTYVAGGLTGCGGDGIFVFPIGNTTPLRTWQNGICDAIPHSLAFSPDESRLFLVVGTTTGLEFYALDQPTVPTTETVTTLSQSLYSIYPGQQVTVSAHVTGTSTGTVHLYGTPTGGGSKTLLDTGSVGAGGNVVFTVSPTVSTAYSAMLDEGQGYAASISGDAVVTVTQPTATSISLAPAQQSILAGGQATLTAVVTGASQGTVDLYGTPNGGAKSLVATTSMGGGNILKFNVSPTATTTYSAVLEPTLGYLGSTSPDAAVTVAQISMQLAASQQAVTYGGKVKLTLHGVQTGAIDLFATPNGETQFRVATATVAAGQQSVTFTIPPARNTSYLAEREDHTAASNSLTVSVRPVLVIAVHVKRTSPQQIRRQGEKVIIGAGRKPPLPGEPLRIVIDRAVAHGGWKTVAQGVIRVGKTGIVLGVLATRVMGQYRVQARYQGDENYTKARSAYRHFRVG